MTKILLTSDWHLSFNPPFNRLNIDGESCRLKEILDSVLWAASIGLENGAEYFVSLGDMFDRAEKLPTKEGLSIFNVLTKVSSAYGKNKHIAITGNHCALSSGITIADLFANTLKVINKPSTLDVDGGRLFFCPYVREPEDLYEVLREFKQCNCPGRKYLFAHFWDTTVMGVDKDSIDLQKVDIRFYDRIFLGHYHAPTKASNNLVVYVGTLLNKSFGETGPKGCWLFDTTKNSIEFIPNPFSPQFYSTEDSVILANPSSIDTNAYYRVSCEAESVTTLTQILSQTKGFELINKKSENTDSEVSIDSVEKKNSLSLRDFVFKNASLYVPEGVTLDEFITKGKELLGAL